jgi:hypothetical protein
MDSMGGRIGFAGEGGLPSRVRAEEDEGVLGGPLVTLLSDFEETVEFLRIGELAEERRDGGWTEGAKDCSKGFGSRSKFDLALRG